jgi:hypothetical protein
MLSWDNGTHESICLHHRAEFVLAVRTCCCLVVVDGPGIVEDDALD